MPCLLRRSGLLDLQALQLPGEGNDLELLPAPVLVIALTMRTAAHMGDVSSCATLIGAALAVTLPFRSMRTVSSGSGKNSHVRPWAESTSTAPGAALTVWPCARDAGRQVARRTAHTPVIPTLVRIGRMIFGVKGIGDIRRVLLKQLFISPRIRSLPF